jgi:ATP-dependent Lon protease
MQRFKIVDCIYQKPLYVSNVEYIYDEIDRNDELEALLRTAMTQFKQISKENPLVSEEIKLALINIDSPGKLADFMSSVLVRDVKDYQSLLSMSDVKDRYLHLLLLLKKELELQGVQKKMQEEINQKVTHNQREFYLQEQLKFIQKELGKDTTEKSKWVDKFKKRLKGKTLPDFAQSRFNEELEKLGSLNDHSAEFSVSLNYLDWFTSMPWGSRSSENYDLEKSKQTLDADHYGLKDIKDRILEYLAVRNLKNKDNQKTEGTILCFVGPPGVGKTSLGKSIATALGRKFFRFSVGGMRDESEIKGHRRTYVGSMPGKMIQGFKRVATQNPVFLIDEIDKLGTHLSGGGDPASALLELLDPEQNKEFLDHYLDVNYDCSEVFFIATANSTDTIPHALLDRMEVIYLEGYTDDEKKHIAKKIFDSKTNF